ncbi:MAG TPA: hypothetical protein PKW90_07995 [Myxococcota bacterium]|nr:hypothetical protein [Myxococcota bacterium]
MARIPYLVKQNEPTILVVERDNVKWEIILNMAIVGVEDAGRMVGTVPEFQIQAHVQSVTQAIKS